MFKSLGFIVFIAGLSGCMMDNSSSTKLASPTGKYYIFTTVNRKDKAKKDYAFVVIHLFDSSGQLKSSLNTGAGDASKWAVGWYGQKDTVILYSAVIDNKAWVVEKDTLKPVELNRDLNKRADELMNIKYNSR